MKSVFCWLALVLSHHCSAQRSVEEADTERCGFVKVNALQSSEKKAVLEAWENRLQKIIAEHRNKRNQNTIYTIPVIVHVIHNGEPVGTGANISAEQVYSQIEVLNEDFNATNTDVANVRGDFKDLVGNVQIRFAPVLHDPEGNLLEEPGIHRFEASKRVWTSNKFDSEIKPATQYDPYRYANFWTVNLGGSLLGYAQFPLNPVVPGLPPGKESDAVADGVVMDYRYFGSVDKANVPQLQNSAPYDLGRTTTHEIGHWLGLFHIWGDGGCNADDEVADTPIHGDSNGGCPSNNATSCGSLDLWENYMDYTDDRCMVMFTQGQVERMRAVIELEPMRQQVVNSDVLVLGNSYIAADKRTVCLGGSVDFSIDLAPNTTLISWEFDGGEPQSSTSLNPQIQYNTEGIYSVLAYVNQEGNNTIDTIHIQEYLKVEDPQKAIALPIEEGFESGLPLNWQTIGSQPWQTASIGNNSSTSIVSKNYGRSIPNETQYLYTPLLDLREETGGMKVSFDWAYTYFNSNTSTLGDGLIVGYIDPCNGDFQELWRGFGEELATAAPQSTPYIPTQEEWRRKEIEIRNISDNDFIQLVFMGVSNGGNQLYLDNISVESIAGLFPAINIDIRERCVGGSVTIENQTRVFGAPTAVEWQWEVEGASPSSSTDFEQLWTFENTGVYDVSLKGTIDGVVYTNTFQKAISVVAASTAPTLIEEPFEESSVFQERYWEKWPESLWGTANDEGREGKALVADYHQQPQAIGDTAMLLLPNLGFQGADENAFISFDWAIGGFDGNYNDLQILYSTDCGQSFNILHQISGNQESIGESTEQAYLPIAKEWKTLRLPLYGINSSQNLSTIRFAMKIIHKGGNNVWIDNLEISTFPSLAPNANFYTNNYLQPTDTGTVYVNEPVSFVSDARYYPKYYTWAFQGAAIPLSEEQHPTVVYEKPGVYEVSLMVSSPYGQNITAKSGYIKVEKPPINSTKVFTNEEGIEVFDRSGIFGYISGHNEFEDLAVAEYFKEQYPYALLERIDLGFLSVTEASTGTITVHVWDEEDGEPGEIIGSYTLPIAEALESAENQTLASVVLPEPLTIDGNFFIGIDLIRGLGTESVALRMNRVFNNTAWTYQNNRRWYSFSTPSPTNWGLSRSLWVFPTLSVPEMIVTDLQSDHLQTRLTVFPNPNTQRRLTWKAEGLRVSGYRIYDFMGKVLTDCDQPSREADLSEFAAGIYLISFDTDRGQVLKKVIIK